MRSAGPFAAVVCVLMKGATLVAQSFQGLGDLPGGYFGSQAFAVLPDGLVVVGESESDGNC
jgi:hypothetical protein